MNKSIFAEQILKNALFEANGAIPQKDITHTLGTHILFHGTKGKEEEYYTIEKPLENHYLPIELPRGFISEPEEYLAIISREIISKLLDYENSHFAKDVPVYSLSPCWEWLSDESGNIIFPSCQKGKTVYTAYLVLYATQL